MMAPEVYSLTEKTDLLYETQTQKLRKKAVGALRVGATRQGSHWFSLALFKARHLEM
jgi:hypothetical protein